MLAGAIYLFYYTTQAKRLAQIDMSSLDQVIGDWNVKPFVEIKPSAIPCEGEFENIFERVWKGTEEGCMTTGKFKKSTI